MGRNGSRGGIRRRIDRGMTTEGDREEELIKKNGKEQCGAKHFCSCFDDFILDFIPHSLLHFGFPCSANSWA